MNPIWLLRMARLARHPPPMGRVKLVMGAGILCLILFGIEQLWGWPDWLSVNGPTKLR